MSSCTKVVIYEKIIIIHQTGGEWWWGFTEPEVSSLQNRRINEADPARSADTRTRSATTSSNRKSKNIPRIFLSRRALRLRGRDSHSRKALRVFPC